MISQYERKGEGRERERENLYQLGDKKKMRIYSRHGPTIIAYVSLSLLVRPS
jgi:hypothetical protein